MVNNKIKEKLAEDELNQNYDNWMNKEISNEQYFREINRIKTKTY